MRKQYLVTLSVQERELLHALISAPKPSRPGRTGATASVGR